jgi:uncharacterized membrane protein YphA (DoxX/SURF4 family)
MSDALVVGVKPWLPWPLVRWTWWTQPVRAERLAALRIGVAAVLLLDVFGTYLPLAGDFFGRDSLGSPEVFGSPDNKRWTIFRAIEDPAIVQVSLGLWGLAAGFLLVGAWPRLNAAIAWLMSLSIYGINSYLHNSGDNVRTIALFYLMLCPCGAVWSLREYPGGRTGPRREPVYISPWALRLLFVQLVFIYFFNGLYKLAGSHWREGDMLQTVMGNLAWTRVSAAQFPLPGVLTQFLTWSVLIWEVGFPLLILIPLLRPSILWIGVAFHLGTMFLQLGPFPLYMLCLYLPLIPWEKYVDRRRAASFNDLPVSS